MRKFFLFGGIALLCTSLLTTSCEKDEKTTPGGGFLARSECMQSNDMPDNPNDSIPVYYDLTVSPTVTYDFDLTSGTGTITCIKYMNCCSEDSIYSIVSVNGSEIIIDNKEIVDEACNCICRYEIVSQIWGAEAKQYTVTVLTNGKGATTFNIDLSKETTGSLFKE
ncbi:MAG: hypothetical protein VZQ98_13725 [Bacteroidales bacterium]|nr:hypothetical protein [Bacteroidales bacterium]